MFMGLQTAIIQIALYTKMALITFLLQPYFPEIKHSLTKMLSSRKSFSPLNHILFVLYGMVLLVFLDSLYRLHFHGSSVLFYQAERNYFISLFALFLAYILPNTVSMVNNMFLAEQINRQNLKQHGHSMTFVNKVIAESKENKEKCEKLEAEITKLKEELHENKGLIAEIENNKQAYLKLKDKYDKLREEKLGDSRKNK